MDLGKLAAQYLPAGIYNIIGSNNPLHTNITMDIWGLLQVQIESEIGDKVWSWEN